jgi:hypothetical protein
VDEQNDGRIERHVVRKMNQVKNRIRLAAIAILSLVFSARIGAQSVQIITVRAWNPVSTPPTLAGNDIVNPYTCTMGDYRLTVRGGGWRSTWHVDVRMTQPAGDPSFILEVRRDPNNNRVQGGTNWVAIGTLNTYFFRSNGRTNVNNLNIQYRIRNVTAGDPNIHEGTFSITITYTIVHSLTHPP